MNANDTQVGGTHYRGEYQTWDFIHDLGLNYFEGNVVKYLSRWHLKNGVEDIKKAQHFLAKWVELVNKNGPTYNEYPTPSDLADRFGAVTRYARAHRLGDLEREAIESLCTWVVSTQLGGCQAYVATLLREATAGPVALPSEDW